MPQIQPAHRILKYAGATGSDGASVTFDIDLARDLSAINRRLYRQGMQYYVSGIHVVGGIGVNVANSVRVFTAGDTWMVHNAWKKGYNLWRSQVNEVKETLPSIEGKWADFKIKLDDASGTLALPLAGDGGSIAADEWNLSQFYWDDDGTERVCTFNMLGASDITSEASLVQEYHISRAQVQAEPNVPAEAADSMYAKSLHMQDELSEDLIDEINADNDFAPYDMSEMVGGDTVADCPFELHQTFGGPGQMTMEIPGFLAECGLVRLVCTSLAVQIATDVGSDDDLDIPAPIPVAASPFVLFLSLAPGPYKGIMATPMGQ